MASQYRPSCGKCRVTWSGASVAHCGSCHDSFVNVVAFDLHRSRGKCWYPEATDTLASVAGLFGTPEQHDTRQRISELGKSSRVTRTDVAN